MIYLASCILLLGALLSPALAAPADTTRAAATPAPAAARPAGQPAGTPMSAIAARPDAVDYESMILPDSEQEYWSLDYYWLDDEPEGADWEDNTRQRDDQSGDTRSDQGE